MRFIWHLILIFFIFIKLSVAQKLLLLFLDGFRWDYIKETDLGGFSDIKKRGAYIEKVIPVFPADCHPNIYSIFTGLYPQHHGVLGNQVYSSKLKRKFDHTNPVHRRDVHEWVDAEPLWVTSKNQGKQSFLYHLPTCESSFGPLSPSYCVPYHMDYMTMDAFNMSVKEALRSLRSGVANMAVVYNDQLDRITHQFGPQSFTLTNKLLPRIDNVIRWLLSNLEMDTHLVVLSDHGMAQIARHRQIYLDRMILRSEIERIINQGGYVGIWVSRGMLNRVKLRLTLASEADGHFQLYTRSTMPPHWNVGGADDLVPDLLMVAQPGFFIASTIHSQFSPIANSTAIKPKHIKKCDENPKQIVEYIKRTKRQVQNVTKLNFDESIESQQIKPESNEIKPNLENNLDNSNFTVLDKVLENLPDSELELTKLAYDYVTESELKLKEKMFIASQPVKVLSNSRCLKWIGVDIKQPEERELKIEIESSVIQKVVIKSMSKEFKLINQGNLTDTLETTFIPNVENNIIVLFQPKTFSFCSGILIIEFFSKKVKINLFGYACQPEVFLSEPRKLPYNSEDASINRSIEISVKNQSPRTAFVSFYDINQCNLQIFPRKFLINPNEIIQVRITFPVERYSAKYGCIFVDECIRRAAKEYYLNNRKRKNKLLNDLEIFHPFQDEDFRIFEKLPNANWIHNLNEQIEKGFISNEITLNQIKYKSIQNIHLNESTDSVKTIDVLSPNNSPTQQRSNELLINNANINALLNKIRSVYKGDLENVVIRKHEYNFPATTVNNKTIVGILIKNFNSDLRLEWSIEDINPSNSMTVFGETRGTFSNFVTIPIQYQPVCAGRMKCEYIIRVTDPKSESYIEKLVKLFGYCTETGSLPNVLYSFQSEIPGFKVEQEILFQIPKDKSEKVVKKLTLTNMTKFQMEIFTLIDSPFQIKKNIILEVRSQSVSVHLQLNKLQNRSSKRLIFFDSDGNATITNLIVLESR